MTDMVPGGRLDASVRAAAAAMPPETDVELFHEADQSGRGTMQAVPVRMVGSSPAEHASYYTITINASAASMPSVRRLLPRDELRQVAWIMPIDNAIIIAASKEQAQDPLNAGGSFPSGGYSPQPVKVTHQEAVYAANTSLTQACRVSVMVETGRTDA